MKELTKIKLKKFVVDAVIASCRAIEIMTGILLAVLVLMISRCLAGGAA